MGWEAVKLGNIADFSNGINFDKSAYTSGVKLIGVSNFKNRFCPDYNELSEVKKDIVRTADYLANGDIVFVRSNGNKELVGRCMLIESPPNPITFSGFCIRLRLLEPQKYDPRFFTYHFKSIDFRRAMSGTAVGTNIQNLSQQRLANYTAFIPDIDTQRRIADILSAYDDLIENNRRQIKLLEEAAQRLYKEWFVKLRFPGWETTEIVDGVPVGWKKVPVGDILKKVPRTKQIQAADYLQDGDIPVIDQSKNFIAGYTNDTEATVTPDEPVIVFGDHTRILKLISFPFAKGADGTQLVVSGERRMPQRLLYCSLVNVDLSNYHYARHFKYLKAEEILVPTSDISNAFEQITTGIFSKIDTCREQATRASQARDCLLPKLMSGELEV